MKLVPALKSSNFNGLTCWKKTHRAPSVSTGDRSCFYGEGLSFTISLQFLDMFASLSFLSHASVSLSPLFLSYLSVLFLVFIEVVFSWHSHITSRSPQRSAAFSKFSWGLKSWHRIFSSVECLSYAILAFGLHPLSHLCFTLSFSSGLLQLFSFVLLYAWIHIVWSPSHLSTPSCVSTCVAYIEDMMLLHYFLFALTCVCVSLCNLQDCTAWRGKKKKLTLRTDLTFLPSWTSLVF